jgi:hypothetical protein
VITSNLTREEVVRYFRGGTENCGRVKRWEGKKVKG